MKRLVALVLAGLMLIGGCALAEVTIEEAKQIALDRAGATAENAVFTKAHPYEEDGRAVFDMEFYVGTTEYDVDVDIATGEIVDFETEEHALVDSNGSITLEAAKQIALAKVGLKEGEATYKEAKLDTEDGRKVYEIELVANGMEYEFDIDAASGAIIKFETEKQD